MRTIEQLANLLIGLAEHVCGGTRDYCDEYAQHTEAGRSFLEAATEAGFTMIGDGYFSMVFTHPEKPDVAFKYSLKDEDMGLHYAVWCRANPSDHVPSILFLRKTKAGYCVVMPKYRPYDFHDQVHQAQYKAIVAGLKMEKAPSDDFRAGVATSGNWWCADALDVAYSIGRYFRGLATVDMHYGNVMANSVGKLIITDPLAQNHTKRPEFNPDRSLPVIV